MDAPTRISVEPNTEDLHEELSMAQSLLYSDKPLSPKMIFSLMHVGASLQNTYIHEVEHGENERTNFLYTFIVVAVSLIVAFVIGVVFLYVNSVGPFYSGGEALAF